MFLLLLCACAGSLGQSVHASFHEAVSSGAAPVVHVDNVAGEVRIAPWSRAVVDIDATKYGADEAELNKVRIDVHRQGNAIFIATSYAAMVRNGGVRYRISVPLGASVQIANTAGSVTIGAIGGDVGTDTQAGSVDARLGRVDGHRSIDLYATTGTITLRIARDSSATVHAQSNIGSFVTDFSTVTQTRRNFVGVTADRRIGAGAAAIRLSTTTGSLSLEAQ